MLYSRGINTAQNITGTHLQGISDTGEVRCLHRAKRIQKDKHKSCIENFTYLIVLTSKHLFIPIFIIIINVLNNRFT